MVFDKIQEIMKPPATKADPNAFKPFGNTPVNPLTGNPMYGNKSHGGIPGRSGLGDSHLGQHANLIKLKLADDRVKVYEDVKKVAERTEMELDEGKVVVYKDYGFSPTLAQYKKIDVLGIDGQVRGSIDMIPNDRTTAHTGYKFIYNGSMIGTGSGDIGLFIAQAIVSRAIQPRTGMGTGVDGEIITTITNILKMKRA